MTIELLYLCGGLLLIVVHICWHFYLNKRHKELIDYSDYLSIKSAENIKVLDEAIAINNKTITITELILIKKHIDLKMAYNKTRPKKHDKEY